MAAPALQAAGAALAGRSLLPRALAARGARAARAAAADRRAARAALLERRVGPDARPGRDPGRVRARLPRVGARVRPQLAPARLRARSRRPASPTHPTTYRGLNAAGCCAGPFQFNVTNGPPSTWDGHKRAFRRGQRPGRLPAPAGAAPVGLRRLRRRHGRRRRCCAPTAPTRPSAPAPSHAVRAYNGAGPVAEAYAAACSTAPARWQRDSRPAPATALPAPGRRRAGVAGARAGHLAVLRAPRWEACHPGIDIAVPTGTPILAAATGRVTLSSRPALGRLRQLHLPAAHRRAQTCYAHQ